MIQLKSISKNRPSGMIVNAEDKDVKALLATGDFVRVIPIIKSSPKKIIVREVKYGSDRIKSPKRL